MYDWNKTLVALAIGWVFASSPAFAQPQPKLRPLRIALPSNTIGATHFYVAKVWGFLRITDLTHRYWCWSPARRSPRC